MNGKCTVTIEGVGMGILFNNPAGMVKVKTSKKVNPSAEEQAERSAYWNEDHTELVFPAWNLRSGLVQAASGLKLPSNKKISLPAIIAGDVEIGPPMLGFGTKEYKVDTRRAVIQRQGILRSRAWLPKWRLILKISWETSTLEDDFDKITLPELLATLGERIGIGDFRPMRRGPFGKFRVVSISR